MTRFAHFIIFVFALFGSCLASWPQTTNEEAIRYVLSQGNIYDMVLQLRNEIDQKFTTELQRQGWSEDSINRELEIVKEPRVANPLQDRIDPTKKEVFDLIADNIKQRFGIEEDITIRILGSLTPIFNGDLIPLSQDCSDASWTYLYNMFALSAITLGAVQPPQWGIQSKI